MSLHSNVSSSRSAEASAEASAFPWILEHLLANPETYEIPLRTMYRLNSTPNLQPYPPQAVSASTIPTSGVSNFANTPATPHIPSAQQQHQGLAAQPATERFRNCLMTYINQLPMQPFSLPPTFVTSFVRRCFPEDICLVDFTQALTALDYLKDLETRRKRELSLAIRRLGVDMAALDRLGDASSRNSPKLIEWVLDMQAKEKKTEAYYTQMYIGLRRWTLINEMRLEPFNKANCIAMLNTLYPPTTSGSPTRQLSPAILASQRNAFFRYIQGVEKNGRGILKNLENQGARSGDANGWPSVREAIDQYLRTATGVIEDCLQVTGPEIFASGDEESRRAERRTDSGVSFATGDRPSTSSSSGSVRKPSSSSSSVNKPLPPSPRREQPSRSATAPLNFKKPMSTLEKIARGIENFRSRNDAKETTSHGDREKARNLKTMKSANSMGGLRAKHARTTSGDYRPLEIDDAKRQKLIFEAKMEKAARQAAGKDRPHEG